MQSLFSTDQGLRYWAVQDPDKVVITFERDSVTFAELDAWVDRLAVYLAGTGVQSGDRVGVVGQNSLEWCVAGLATIRVGAIHAALDPRLVAHEMHGLTNLTGTRTVFVAPTHREAMQEVSDRGPKIDLIPFEVVSGLRHGEPARYERPQIDPDEVAAIVYSSGSTGMPKGISYSMRGILYMMFELALMEPVTLGRECRILCQSPLAPVGAFLNSIVRATVVGGTVFLQRKFEARDALRLLVEERCSSLMAVPLVFQKISALPEFENADLSSLEYAIIGGAPVPLDEFDKWFARGASLRQVYGSTEAGGHFTFQSAAESRSNRARAGAGGMFRKIKLVRPDGSTCAPNEDGHVLVTGPSITVGYWNDPQATADILKDGWLYTGDLGQVDENGYLMVTDRIKEVIITGGYNVGPTEVETALLAHPAVEDAAVVPVKDATYGEAIGAIVHVTAPTTKEEIYEHCRTQLAGYKVPRYLVITERSLPRSELGKRLKKEMLEEYGERLARSRRA
jgi:fatty-acyl-CoA synthase